MIVILKIDKLKQELSETLCLSETGEDVDVDELIEKVIGCNKEDNRKRQREGLSKKLSRNILEFNISKTGDRRSFDLVYSDDIKEKELDITSHWVYCKLRENLVKDGSCRSEIITDEVIVDSRNKLYKFCNIGKDKGRTALGLLEKENLIKIKTIGRRCIFLINPIYYRFGNKIHDNIRSEFDIPSSLFKD